MDPLLEFSKNYIFWTSLSAWAIAQTIKVILGIFREKRFNFKWFVGTGGMPSSHAASVAALSTSVGITHGFDSAIFAITLTFTVIVMFDAHTVRFSAGRQAKLLNRMLDDIYWKHKLDDEKLKEFLGHTPIQVLVGAALGIVVALLMYK